MKLVWEGTLQVSHLVVFSHHGGQEKGFLSSTQSLIFKKPVRYRLGISDLTWYLVSPQS